MANFPETRLRRLRTNQKMRDLVQEVSISPKDLICPVFVEEGIEAKKQIIHVILLQQETANEGIHKIHDGIAFWPQRGSKGKEQEEGQYIII